jgi:hypothetical protein
MSGLIDDISGITSGWAGSWTNETARRFWPLALDFYNDSGFAEFYRSNIPFYRDLSAPFIDNERVSGIDTGWFATVAKRYEKTTPKMKYYQYFISPSIHESNVGLWAGDTANPVMVAILGRLERSDEMSESLVHEYCHSFCNPTAIDALMTNKQFQAWAEATNSSYWLYDDELTVSVEYVVRAYTILYFADHGYNDSVAYLLEWDKELGFSYINEVYQWVRGIEGR